LRRHPDGAGDQWAIEQARFERRVVELARQWPGQTRLTGTAHMHRHRSHPDRARLGDLTVGQLGLVLELENLAQLPHRQPLRSHPVRSPCVSGGPTVGSLPMSDQDGRNPDHEARNLDHVLITTCGTVITMPGIAITIPRNDDHDGPES
jgi:hypothetical protein